MSYFEEVKLTYLESWPAALSDLSIPQVEVQLTLEEASALGSNIIELFEAFGEPAGRDISGIRERVDRAIRQFPNGAFVRLGSRSPKDSWRGLREGFRCCDGEKAVGLLTDCSERIADDLQLAIAENYKPRIFVREWQDIPEWSEFRCFMKDRRLVGISQYNYLKKRCFPEIEVQADYLRMAIEDFFERFRTACHLDTVIFDVFIKQQVCLLAKTVGSCFWQVKLIEINPFFDLTDPCLFRWGADADFDGSFRFIRSGETVSFGRR
ncbi:MAG: hypothetical protein ACRD7E_26635 [Bryobacteraceae bacterium]